MTNLPFNWRRRYLNGYLVSNVFFVRRTFFISQGTTVDYFQFLKNIQIKTYHYIVKLFECYSNVSLT